MHFVGQYLFAIFMVEGFVVDIGFMGTIVMEGGVEDVDVELGVLVEMFFVVTI